MRASPAAPVSSGAASFANREEIRDRRTKDEFLCEAEELANSRMRARLSVGLHAIKHTTTPRSSSRSGKWSTRDSYADAINGARFHFPVLVERERHTHTQPSSRYYFGARKRDRRGRSIWRGYIERDVESRARKSVRLAVKRVSVLGRRGFCSTGAEFFRFLQFFFIFLNSF